MKFLRMTFLPGALALGVALSFSSLAAQESGTLTGQVLNAETGQPLSEAQMVIVGTNIGVLTNESGRYLITRVPAGTREIRAVLLGFAQQTQAVTIITGQSAVIDFNLNPTAIALEALVVSSPAGREQRARELGTNVAQVNVEELNLAPITRVADILAGRAAGIVLQDVNGATGTSQRIRIRGANSLSLNNEPLIFLDGVLVNSEIGGAFGVGGQEPSRLNDINPNDIESMEVVKGPAASALYGTAAANGVILITTKRGRPGGAEYNVWAETGTIEDVTDWRGNWASYQIDDASQPLLDPDGWLNTDAYSHCSNRAAAAGTCVQDGSVFFNTMTDSRTTPLQTGSRGRYGASVRGGSEQVRYFVSGQYENEEGVIFFNSLEKINVRANLDAAISEDFDLSVSFGYTDSNLALNSNDNSIFSPIINGILGQPTYIKPEAGEFPDGVPNDDNYGWGYNNYELKEVITNQDVDRMTLSSSLSWRPFSWLTMNGNGGLDLTDMHNHETVQPDRIFAWEEIRKGYRNSERENRYLYSALLSGIATFQLADQIFSTTTLGFQYTENKAQATECYGSSLVAGTASCGTTSAFFYIDEDFFNIKTVGGYVQQEFAWRDNVFVAAGIRGDDNSAFGADFGLVYYPSAAVSWVIGDEDWFPELDWISGLRVRTAYGTSGLRPGMRDAVTLFSPRTVSSGSGDLPGVYLSTTGNTTLEPERTTEYEFGLDAGFLGDRLGVEFTYYNKTSKDALIQRRLPGSLGLTTSVFANLGSIKNQGTELLVYGEVIRRDNFGLSVGFTNTSLKNEVIDLGAEVEPIIFNRGQQRHEETYSAGSFFQREISWDDADGNGKLTNDEVSLAADATFHGVSLPKWQRTLFADLRIADWITVTTLFEGRGGHLTANDTEGFRCGRRSTYGCDAVGNPDASLEEQARYIADRYLGSSGGYLEKADFWKWRELSVSFDIPTFLSKHAPQLDGLRITMAGRNLAVWTDYTGIDPETVEGGASANFSQSEFNTQPPVRYLMLRLDYSFR